MSAVAALREPDAVLEPGGEVTAEISVLNIGTIVDQFEIDVIGAPAAWAYVEPSVMSLFPNTQQVATIRFRPPLSHDVPPGPTPFAVRVVPSNAPDHCVTEEGMLLLAPFKDVAVEMIPTTVEGRIRARAHLAVDSRGNFPFTVLIQASDPAAALVIRARPPTLDLRPNQASFSQIYIVPRRRHIRGGVKQHRFKVLVDDAGTTIASIDGTMVQPPLIPKWLLALIIILIAAVIWLVLIRPAIKDSATAAAANAVAGQQARTNAAASAAQTANSNAAVAAQKALAAEQKQLAAEKAQAAQNKATASSLANIKKQIHNLSTTTSTTTTVPKLQTVSYDNSLEDVVASGTDGSATWTVPSTDSFAMTDFVLDSLGTGQTGTVRVQLITVGGTGPQTLLEISLSQLGTVPFETARFQTPIAISASEELVLNVSCDQDQSDCQVGLLFAGALTQPTPTTTTTTTTTSSSTTSTSSTSTTSTSTTSTTSTTTTTTSPPFSGGPDRGAATRRDGSEQMPEVSPLLSLSSVKWHRRRAARLISVLVTTVALAAPAAVALSIVAAAPAGATSQTVTDKTGGETAYVIPSNTVALQVTVVGQAGGSGFTGDGGQPAEVTATIPPPQGAADLYLQVATGAGSSDFGGAGGGESAVQTCSTSSAGCSDDAVAGSDPRLLAAGGGGGGGEDSFASGTGGAGGSAGVFSTSIPGGGGAGTTSGTGGAGGAAGVQTSSSEATGGASTTGCLSESGDNGQVGTPGQGGSAGTDGGDDSSGGAGGAGWVGGAGGGAGDCPSASGGSGGGGGAGTSFYESVARDVNVCTLGSSGCLGVGSAAEVVVTAYIGTVPTPSKQTYTDTTSGQVSYAVPPGTLALQVTVTGAAGSTAPHGGTGVGSPGSGAVVTATIPPPSSTSTLYLEIGSGGGSTDYGTTGGGESAVQTCSDTAGGCTYTAAPSTDPRIVVAGGGGGGGENSFASGTGGTGGSAGSSSSYGAAGAGGAGTTSGNGGAGGGAGFEVNATAGAAGASTSACLGQSGGRNGGQGTPGQGGIGGSGGSSDSSGSGGGGGWIGGSGGGAGDCPGSSGGSGAGGGGGSSFSEASSTTVSIASAGTSARAEIVIVALVGTVPSVTTTSGTLTAGTDGRVPISTGGDPVPSLSISGNLPSGVTFTDNDDGTASLSGTPTGSTVGGPYSLVVTANNGYFSKVTSRFTLTVDQAPTITSVSSFIWPSAGQSGSFQVTSTAYPTSVTYSETGTLPTGLTFSANGSLSGTPAAGTGGNYPLNLTASNGVSPSGTQSFDLQVYQAPALAGSGAATFTVGTSGSTAGSPTVAATGYPTPSFTHSGSIPSGISLIDNGDGTATFTGQPAAGTGGVYPITIGATSNAGTASPTESFTLTVDEAPSITSTSSATFVVGQTPTPFTVSTSGYPDGTLVATSASGGAAVLPQGVSFVGNPDGTATLSGTPAAGTTGTYTFVIDASNGISPSTSQTFTLYVDQTPEITTPSSTTFTVGTAGSFTVQTTAAPAVTSIGESGALPGGLSWDNGVLSGTPEAGTGGVYPLTVDASNGVEPDAMQSLTVDVDQAPAITSSGTATMTVGMPATVDIATTGFPLPTITETGALPAGVTLSDSTNGTATLSGTPAVGDGGVYDFTLVADNGVYAAVAQSFTLTVNEAPGISSAATATFQTGAKSTFTVTATGYPVAAISQTGSLPSGVTFTDNGNGTATLAGTPAATTGGTYDLTLKVSNSVSSTTQAFTLVVDQPLVFTSAATDTFNVGQPGTFTLAVSGYPLPSITDGSASLPSGVTFTANGNGTATLAGTPIAGTGGDYAVTLTATNGVSTVATQHFSLAVDQPLAITSASGATFEVGQSKTFDVTVTGFPLATISDGGARLPAGVTFKPAGSNLVTISGLPAALSGGVYPFTITATNGVSAPATQLFGLTVLEAPTFRSAAAESFVLGRASSFTVSVAAYPGGGNVHISDGNATLPSGVTYHDNGNGTATFSGTPALTSAVSFPVTLTASNGISPNAVQRFVLTVVNPPGYAMVSNDGGVFAFGVKYVGSLPGSGIHVTSVIAITETLDGGGYWIATATGAVYAYGDAHSYGSVVGPLNSPVVGMDATPDGRGYWLVAKDGGIFAFGDAHYVGSVPGLGVVVDDIAGMTSTRDGKGYYLAGANGTVYGLGDAVFHGGAVSTHFGSPVIAIALDRSTEGYWIVSTDGGVFAFDAGYFGATAAPGNVAGIAPSPDDGGYVLVSNEGAVYAHGDARSAGSLAPGASSSIVAISVP